MQESSAKRSEDIFGGWKRRSSPGNVVHCKTRRTFTNLALHLDASGALEKEACRQAKARSLSPLLGERQKDDHKKKHGQSFPAKMGCVVVRVRVLSPPPPLPSLCSLDIYIISSFGPSEVD